MIDFIIYDTLGRIFQTGSCQSELLQEQITMVPTHAGMFVMGGAAKQDTQYISSGIVTDRLTQPTTLNKLTLTADGIDTITLSNAPSGTFTATNTTTRETVTGAINGTDSFLTTIQGTYKIRIESWPFLDFEATINAL